MLQGHGNVADADEPTKNKNEAEYTFCVWVDDSVNNPPQSCVLNSANRNAKTKEEGIFCKRQKDKEHCEKAVTLDVKNDVYWDVQTTGLKQL